MSQPPQNGWGQQPSPGDPYGQSSANSGYGQDAQGSFAPSFGSADTQGYAPQTPEKKSGGKIAIFVCAGCAVLALLLVLVGGGIFLFTSGGDDSAGGGEETTSQEETSEEETTEEEPTEEEPTTEEAATEEATSEEATSEEATEEETSAASGSGQGTKDAPYALGDTFTVEDGEGGTIDVTIGEVNWEATDAVMGANEFNEAPGEGETYILVPVSMTYHGDGTAEPGLSLMIDFVSEGGNTYSDEGTVTPNSWLDVGTLHDGGTGEWEIGMIIPADQARGGHFTVSPLLNFEAEDVWVKAA